MLFCNSSFSWAFCSFPLPGHPVLSLLACSGLSIRFAYSLHFNGLWLLLAGWFTQNIIFIWFLSYPELQREGLEILTSFSLVQTSVMSSWTYRVGDPLLNGSLVHQVVVQKARLINSALIPSWHFFVIFILLVLVTSVIKVDFIS